MESAAPLPPPESSDNRALVLSATVHLLLLGALFFGVQWKSQAPASVEVEVWRAPPPSVPVSKPLPQPEPPPPPRPEPKPVAKVEPPPIKPDIAIKEDKKPKKQEPKEEKPPKEAPKKPAEKPALPDWQKELANEQKQLRQEKAAQEQRARAEAELNQRGQIKAEQAALSRPRGQADYAAKVRGKIRGNIVLPPAIQGNPEAIFDVTQLPSGDVLTVRIRKSSGNRLLDEAIERAILKSSPLPKPDDPVLFDRSLKIPYKPFEE